MMIENTYVHNYMNEHAKKIWKAWADGKLVQTQQEENGEWRTLEPIQVMPEMMPNRVPDRWRIKPETRSELRHLRVYLDEEENSAAIYHLSSGRETKRFENMDYFGGWITSWIPYRVEVEQ